MVMPQKSKIAYMFIRGVLCVSFESDAKLFKLIHTDILSECVWQQCMYIIEVLKYRCQKGHSYPTKFIRITIKLDKRLLRDHVTLKKVKLGYFYFKF
jgi:hypothetical protein